MTNDEILKCSYSGKENRQMDVKLSTVLTDGFAKFVLLTISMSRNVADQIESVNLGNVYNMKVSTHS